METNNCVTHNPSVFNLKLMMLIFPDTTITKLELPLASNFS
jgi:uncharacterized Fe-S cluster protein YjdI